MSHQEYEQAIINISRLIPELIKAMNELSRAINRMPHSIRMRP